MVIVGAAPSMLGVEENAMERPGARAWIHAWQGREGSGRKQGPTGKEHHPLLPATRRRFSAHAEPTILRPGSVTSQRPELPTPSDVDTHNVMEAAAMEHRNDQAQPTSQTSRDVMASPCNPWVPHLTLSSRNCSTPHDPAESPAAARTPMRHAEQAFLPLPARRQLLLVSAHRHQAVMALHGPMATDSAESPMHPCSAVTLCAEWRREETPAAGQEHRSEDETPAAVTLCSPHKQHASEATPSLPAKLSCVISAVSSCGTWVYLCFCISATGRRRRAVPEVHRQLLLRVYGEGREARLQAAMISEDVPVPDDACFLWGEDGVPGGGAAPGPTLLIVKEGGGFAAFRAALPDCDGDGAFFQRSVSLAPIAWPALATLPCPSSILGVAAWSQQHLALLVERPEGNEDSRAVETVLEVWRFEAGEDAGWRCVSTITDPAGCHDDEDAGVTPVVEILPRMPSPAAVAADNTEHPPDPPRAQADDRGGTQFLVYWPAARALEVYAHAPHQAGLDPGMTTAGGGQGSCSISGTRLQHGAEPRLVGSVRLPAHSHDHETLSVVDAAWLTPHAIAVVPHAFPSHAIGPTAMVAVSGRGLVLNRKAAPQARRISRVEGSDTPSGMHADVHAARHVTGRLLHAMAEPPEEEVAVDDVVGLMQAGVRAAVLHALHMGDADAFFDCLRLWGHEVLTVHTPHPCSMRTPDGQVRFLLASDMPLLPYLCCGAPAPPHDSTPGRQAATEDCETKGEEGPPASAEPAVREVVLAAVGNGPDAQLPVSWNGHWIAEAAAPQGARDDFAGACVLHLFTAGLLGEADLSRRAVVFSFQRRHDDRAMRAGMIPVQAALALALPSTVAALLLAGPHGDALPRRALYDPDITINDAVLLARRMLENELLAKVLQVPIESRDREWACTLDEQVRRAPRAPRVQPSRNPTGDGEEDRVEGNADGAGTSEETEEKQWTARQRALMGWQLAAVTPPGCVLM